MGSLSTTWRWAACSATCIALAGCGGAGSFVWIDELPQAQNVAYPENEYLIREGDLVAVRVFNQENLSTRARVRSDGRLALPLLGDIEVRGKRPSALKGELEARLKDYVNPPSVTVTVEEFQPINVSVLGEVQRQGSFPFDPRASLATVIATAGGLTEFASRDSIYVVRRTPRALRVRFTYDDVRRGDPRTAAFSLQNGDLVVVE